MCCSCTVLQTAIKISTQASDMQPLLATMFEGAWPVSVYLDRYLQHRLAKYRKFAWVCCLQLLLFKLLNLRLRLRLRLRLTPFMQNPDVQEGAPTRCVPRKRMHHHLLRIPPFQPNVYRLCHLHRWRLITRRPHRCPPS
jgi:hypothetical protein